MIPHPHFDLRLHTDTELGSLLGEQVTARRTLHEWPLSCVHQIRTRSGGCWIYKSAAGPTLESEFYASARSPLLVRAETVYRDACHSCLLMPYIDAPRLAACDLKAEELLNVAEAITQEIQHIKGDLPAYVDICGESKWGSFGRRLVLLLSDMVADGTFLEVRQSHVAQVAAALAWPGVVSTAAGPSAYGHGDLSVENLFVTADGYRLIDWQRPVVGPIGLDWVTLLESAGYAAGDHMDDSLVTISRLLRIQWLAECSKTWFPPGRAAYDQQIASSAEMLGSAS